MKKTILFLITLFSVNVLFAQSSIPAVYGILVKQADSLYNVKAYKESAFTYSAAFKANNDRGSDKERYNAACSWALANYPDSAFSNLQKSGYTNYDHIIEDSDLGALHNDKRWQPTLSLIKANLEKEEANFNKPLVKELDTIFHDDQDSRLQIETVEKK